MKPVVTNPITTETVFLVLAFLTANHTTRVNLLPPPADYDLSVFDENSTIAVADDDNATENALPETGKDQAYWVDVTKTLIYLANTLNPACTAFEPEVCWDWVHYQANKYPDNPASHLISWVAYFDNHATRTPNLSQPLIILQNALGEQLHSDLLYDALADYGKHLPMPANAQV